MAECQHENFAAEVDVHRLTDADDGPVTGYMVDVRVKCAQCGCQFKFLGLQKGLDTDGAAMSWDQTEAHLAISPDGLQPLCKGPKGFRITERSGHG